MKPRSEAKSLTPFDSLIYAQPLRGEAIIISYALLLFTAVLALANLATVGRAHRAILRGDWFAHRNMMLVSLALWGLTLLAAAGMMEAKQGLSQDQSLQTVAAASSGAAGSSEDASGKYRS